MPRHHAGRELFSGEAEICRTFFIDPEGVGRHHSKAVDVRAIEVWHVDGCHDVPREYPSESAFERHGLLAQWGHGEMLMEDGLGFLFRQDLEKLFLFHQ